MQKIIDPEVFDCVNSIEDPEDCAILDDESVEDALDDIESEGISDDDLVDDDEDIPVDTNQDYSGDMIDLDIEGADADEIIAAERDIAADPFEDDELIDIAMNTDDGIDIAADDLDDDDDISEI